MKNILLTVLAMLGCLTASAQWGANPDGVAILPEGESIYDNQSVIGADGTIWFYAYHPNDGVYQMTIQALDKDGNKKFGDEGLVVSDYANLSWTEVNQYIYPNSDGSITMVVRDLRNSNDDSQLLSYTAYRISPEGKQLWGEDGVNIDEGMQADGVRCISFCELSDGSTAFVWQHDYSTGTCLEIQRVSKDGECLYNLDETRLCKTNGYYVYPNIVPSDNGSFIIVYGYTSSYYLKAMKYNSDGTQAWDSQVNIYKGGWGSVMSLQSRMHVYPGPDGGVVVGWNGDPDNDEIYYAYVCYIKKDGTAAFSDEDGNPYVKLSYEEYSAYPPHLALSDDYIYAIFSQFSPASQNWNQLTVQKVNINTGEILWGDNGMQVVPMQSEFQLCGSERMQLGRNGQMGCFFEQFYDYHNIQNSFSLRSTTDGEAVNEDNPTTIWRSSGHYRDMREVMRSDTDNTWVAYWIDDPNSSDPTSETRSMLFTKMTFDGNDIDMTGIKNINDNADDDDNIFNIAGQRIIAPQDGQIYIQGGKKLMK